MSVLPNVALQPAIEGLYATFARYSLTAVVGCPCCVSAEDQANLRARDLRQLTADNLGRYAGKAMSTWGDVHDFKHFLPRIYELTAAFEAPYEEFVVFDKLNDGAWRSWPAVEIEALEYYFRALWQAVLASEEGYFGDYFPALAAIYPRFEELLQDWETAESNQALVLLAEEVQYRGEALWADRYFDGPFFHSLPLSQRLREWVTSDGMQEKLFLACCQATEEAVNEKLVRAYDAIAYARK